MQRFMPASPFFRCPHVQRLYLYLHAIFCVYADCFNVSRSACVHVWRRNENAGLQRSVVVGLLWWESKRNFSSPSACRRRVSWVTAWLLRFSRGWREFSLTAVEFLGSALGPPIHHPIHHSIHHSDASALLSLLLLCKNISYFYILSFFWFSNMTLSEASI